MPKLASLRRVTLLILTALFLTRSVFGHCECGYSVRDQGAKDATWIFTDIIESDFKESKDISRNSDWMRQQFNVSAKAGRGEYGKAFIPSNIGIFAPPSSGNGQRPEQSGLKLRVGSDIANGAVSGAEMDTTRQDIYHGSFRTGMKLTRTNGTCAAFFWYFNDTQEIDIEFLSREFSRDTSTYPVNLVIQSQGSAEAGYDAKNTGTYKRINLTFDPTAGFHEYRFDYLPGQVNFYADSEMLAEMNGSAIPTSPGHLILQHWSNGNPLWSGGPPTQDTFVTVSYVKAYFNSSNAALLSVRAKRCDDFIHKGRDHAFCEVPNVTAANASTGGHFFSNAENPMVAGGQEESDGNSDSRASCVTSLWTSLLLFLGLLFIIAVVI